jgi:hypothetical protein
VNSENEVVFEGIHCALRIRRLAAGVVLVVFDGRDIGEFGDGPFAELEKEMEGGRPIEIFVDARRVSGASIRVSGDWARWMSAHRTQLHRLSILCGSKFVEVTAKFVRQFTAFGDRMRIYTDAPSFERALATAVRE